MTKQEKLAKALLRPINPSLVIILGIYTILWGIWLVIPWETFSSAPVYSMMATLAPEWVWGAVAIVCGIGIVLGAVTRRLEYLEVGAFLAHFHWLIIAIFYLVGDLHNTGGITSLTFATYAALVWLNLKVNRKHFGKHE